MRAAPEITLKYNNSYAKLSKNRYTNISVIVTIKKIIYLVDITIFCLNEWYQL
jgi:hypothetical protein